MTSEKTPATVVAEPAPAKEIPPDDVKIARIEIPPVIRTADEYDKAYRYLASRYHVLTPVTAFSGMAPQHGLVVAKVLIDHDPAHGEVYQDKLFCKVGNKDPLDDDVAIAKVGLRKLALAGGWNLSADVLRAERHYWMVRGYNRFIGLDGSVQTFSAIEEYDLRDGSPQIRGWTDKQKEQARAHGLRGGEARALNAACREYGIRQKYTRRDLTKAFVIMRMMFIPDASNELQMRIVTERALQGTTAMYPQASPSMLTLDSIDGLNGQVGSSSTGDVPTEKATATPPEFGVPPTPHAVRIVKVELKSGETHGRKWTKCTVIDHNGVEYSTFDTKAADAAEKFKADGAWVDIIDEQRGEYRNITELGPALPDEPSLPLTE